MADSNITKRALAVALRELMEEVPFEKIQVAHICERCDMNRKSFYYHFKDKYDLLNWIFDTEIISFLGNYSGTEQHDQHMEMLSDIFNYFYQNKNFYRSALKTKGQNSFSEHFREYIEPIFRVRLTALMGDSVDDFTVNFFTDGGICTMERWLLDKECLPPDQFVSKLLDLVQLSGKVIYTQFNQEKQQDGAV